MNPKNHSALRGKPSNAKGKKLPGRPVGTGRASTDPSLMPNSLRLWRVQKGMTSDQVAREVGMTGSHLCKIERGETILYAADAVKLARLYGTTVEALLEVPSRAL